MQEAPLEYPEAHNVRLRDSLLSIAKAAYFIHLFLVAIYSLMLLALEPRLTARFTLTLLLVLAYGLMMVWIFGLNLVCVMIRRDKWAVWCNRFIAKMIIMVFPFFCLFGYLSDRFLGLRSVSTFMIYLLVFSLLMISYEVYSCEWGHHQQPAFLYNQNDLLVHHDSVW